MRIVVDFLIFSVIVGLIMAGFSYVIMILWNWLIAELFGLPILTWIEALGLWVLVQLFSGPFRR